jgi:hypothetical protein
VEKQFRSLYFGLILTALLVFVPGIRASASANAEISSGLCPPNLSQRHPGLCADYGPGYQTAQLARTGLYPALPIPATDIDPYYWYVPFDYLSIGEGGTTVYPSKKAAAEGRPVSRRMNNGFMFLSYRDLVDFNGRQLYQTTDGEYVRAGDNVSRITPPTFQGLAFDKTPARPFGWMIGGIFAQQTPGGTEDYTERWMSRLATIQIYDSREVDNTLWYMIGPDEWVEERLTAIVTPDPTRPEGVEDDRWVTINLYEQTVTAYENGELVFATLSSTGRDGAWTQPGSFQVWARLEKDDMTGGLPNDESFYYLEDVPWVLYYDQARAIHGTYWHAKFGYTSSRGCVNVTPQDAHWIFDFAQEGTWIHVWDPTGETPTDPDIYGAGGA